jgi:hypothetical protein
VDENETTGRYRVIQRANFKALFINLICAGLVLAVATGYAGYLFGKHAAKGEIAAAKANTDAGTLAPTAASVPAPIDGGTVAVTVAPAVAPVMKTTPAPEPDVPAGEWVVRLHTLYSTSQITIEKREVLPALEKCGKDAPVSLCIAKVNGQKKAMASLVRGIRGMSEQYAKTMSQCFNKHMRVVDQPNQAEPAPAEEFEDACVLGPGEAQ